MEEALLWSVKNGELDEVKKIVGNQPDLLKKELASGRLAIHYAADYGQPDVIEYLISKGADVNIPDKHGITPLLAAIYEGHTKCVKSLLQKGADKNGKDPSGQSYYECAEVQEIKDLLK
ncbi:myotrophin-like [Gigantopelta aegis]|uniref:myotrophin-like n=1 Tax=Gigantopelta aegis TaxID=1735272 RepID=UPI001B88E44A|nr:myotrophin-like [Gigantopelta aegis]